MDDQTAATDDQAERTQHAGELARLRRENAALRTLIARMVHGAGGVYLVPRDALLQVELAHHRLEATTTAGGLEIRLRPGATPAGVAAPAPAAEAPEAPAQPATEPATEDAIEAAARPLAEPVAAPALLPLTQSEVMAMPLAAFETHFGFRPAEALEKYWFAITGKRLGAAERAAIVASLAGRLPDLSHVVMQ